MDKPVFDFSNTTRKWSKAFTASTYKVTRAQAKLVKQEDVEAALALLDEAADEQEALIAEVLVSVPREWLATSAPDEIDWHDPKSLDWVRPDYYGELLAILQSGDTGKSAAKN